MSAETMPFDRTAATPGDGNPAQNAKGRVYSSQQHNADEVQVADLRNCVYGVLVAVSFCMTGKLPRKPELKQPEPAAVTVIVGPAPKP